jgi:hypothetical protein
VKPNESLPQIAAKYGMSAETLLTINGIGPRTRVPPATRCWCRRSARPPSRPIR